MLALLAAIALAPAGATCPSIAVSHDRLARVVVSRGQVPCAEARNVVKGFFAARVGFRADRRGEQYRPVSGWRCYTALAGSQTRCTRGSREVIGDTAWPGGFIRCAPPVRRVFQLRA